MEICYGNMHIVGCKKSSLPMPIVLHAWVWALALAGDGLSTASYKSVDEVKLTLYSHQC